MKEPKTDLYPQLEQGQVPVERLSAGSRTVVSICVAIGVAVVGWVTIRADISANAKDLLALSVKVDEIQKGLKAFDQLSDLKVEVSNLKTHGSDNLQALALRLDRLREDFRVHIAKYHPKEPDIQP